MIPQFPYASDHSSNFCHTNSPRPYDWVTDKYSLYFLGFEETKNTARDIERLRKRLKATIEPGRTDPLRSIEEEIQCYFDGKLTDFKPLLYVAGTPFQNMAWKALKAISYGETRSYADQATAYRAVANANGLIGYPLSSYY